MTDQQPTSRIRLLVLLPLIASFFLALAVVVYATNAFYIKQQHHNIHDITNRIKHSLDKHIKNDVTNIKGLLQFVANNSALRSAWLNKDRKSLSTISQRLYRNLNTSYGITHFYLHTLDGKNFLRAHRPGRFGDNINRKTLLTARRTGQIGAGLELGTFGQFVLRVVQPWVIDGQLAGYIELGVGIDHITNEIKQATGADLITLIDKQLINRNDWFKVFGKHFDWQRLPNWAIASSTLENIPNHLDLLPLRPDHSENLAHSRPYKEFEITHFSLYNFSDEPVGYMVVIHNNMVSNEQLHQLLSTIIIAALVFGSLIFVAYYIYLGKIEDRLTLANRSLHKKIDEQKKIENELRLNRDELTTINRELESYSYSIAHDLRAPLRSVTSFSQIVLEDAKQKLSTDEIENLQRVINASKRMALLIDDILQLSRITREELSIETVNLSSIAEHQKDRLTRNEPERNVAWEIEQNMFARVDPRLIERALENLIQNAWKYTAYTDAAKIRFGTLQRNGETIYFVNDNGAGFDMNYAHKLFATFQRLHNPREFAGSGVGLAIVLRVIQRHHGRIWGEGEVGKGATFYFTLPDIRTT